MFHGKLKECRKKRKYEIGGKPVETSIGADRSKQVGVKGGQFKTKLVSSEYANVVVEGKNVRCKIVDLVENPANKDYTRRRIITKGAVLSVKTPEGKDLKVKVRSKPGQMGVLDAVVV